METQGLVRLLRLELECNHYAVNTIRSINVAPWVQDLFANRMYGERPNVVAVNIGGR